MGNSSLECRDGAEIEGLEFDDILFAREAQGEGLPNGKRQNYREGWRRLVQDQEG